MRKFWDEFSSVACFLFVVALSVPVFWISSAYAAQLNVIGAPTPNGAFTKFGTGKLGSTVRVQTTPTLKNGFQSLTSNAKLVINSETWMSRWLSTVNMDRKNLLWSSYPASIRGQVFSGSQAGGDPLSTGGW